MYCNTIIKTETTTTTPSSTSWLNNDHGYMEHYHGSIEKASSNGYMIYGYIWPF